MTLKSKSQPDSTIPTPFQIFEISLNSEEYFPGEIVTGKLFVLSTRRLRLVGGIFIKFEGRASSKWKKRGKHLCGLREAEFVHGKKSYFVNIYRYDTVEIPEGNSDFPFEFELPSGIPASTHSTPEDGSEKHLKIRYSVEALLRKGLEEEYRLQKTFRVKGLFNLNAFPELAFPVSKTTREAIFQSCWSSSGRMIILSCSTKKQAFVPGERVIVEITIKCASLKTLTKVTSGADVQVIQEIEVKMKTNSQIRRRIIVRNDLPKQEAAPPCTFDKARRTHELNLPFCLKIPDDCLISYEDCTDQFFLGVRHFIRVSIPRASFPYKPLQLQLPIKIGTVSIKAVSAPPILLLTSVPLALPRPRIPPVQKIKSTTNIDSLFTNDCSSTRLASANSTSTSLPTSEVIPHVMVNSLDHVGGSKMERMSDFSSHQQNVKSLQVALKKSPNSLSASATQLVAPHGQSNGDIRKVIAEATPTHSSILNRRHEGADWDDRYFRIEKF